MLFQSVTFLFLFLPAVLIVYSVFDRKICVGQGFSSSHRQDILNLVLVIFSLAFYAWGRVDHTFVLIGVLFINYLFGLAKTECRPALLLGVAYDLYILFRYKYLSLILIFLKAGDPAGAFAPLGISFIIFHCISYLMDLYQDREAPERNLIAFALYISFFAKLAQGPIVKYRDMRAQLRARKPVSAEGLLAGTERFVAGLGKKVLIADLLGETTSRIFSLLPDWGIDTPTAWIGCMAYAMQLYMDFSGYSDMAIGLCKMFGFQTEENFRFPYRSRSVTEFWRRWHISLGSWFRDYLYIPLGGNRKGNVYVHLFLVFLATGVWHGAGILFLIWGIGHGLCVMWERRARSASWYQKCPEWLKWAVTMLLVSIGWLCFCMPDTAIMKQYLSSMFGRSPVSENGYLPFTWQYFISPRFVFLMLLAAGGSFLLGDERVQRVWKTKLEMLPVIQAVRYLFLLSVWFLSFITIVATQYSPFLYFQF